MDLCRFLKWFTDKCLRNIWSSPSSGFIAGWCHTERSEIHHFRYLHLPSPVFLFTQRLLESYEYIQDGWVKIRAEGYRDTRLLSWPIWYDTFFCFLYTVRTAVTLVFQGCLPAYKSHHHCTPPLAHNLTGQTPLKRGQIYCATECSEGFLGRLAPTAEVETRKEDEQGKLLCCWWTAGVFFYSNTITRMMKIFSFLVAHSAMQSQK